MHCLGCSFPFYKGWLLWYVSSVVVCRLRLDMIGPARSDLLETPRHARPRVCVQSFIQLPLKDCHGFTSLLVSLLLLRCRRQSSVWSERLSAGGRVTGVYSGGLGKDCEHGDLNDLMCPVQPRHTPAKLCSSQCSDFFAFFCRPTERKSKWCSDKSDYNWRGANYQVCG